MRPSSPATASVLLAKSTGGNSTGTPPAAATASTYPTGSSAAGRCHTPQRASSRYVVIPTTGLMTRLSQPFEAAVALPVGHRGIKRVQLYLGGIQVMPDDFLSEGGLGHLAVTEQLGG